MSFGAYAGGVVFLIAVVGACGVAAAALVHPAFGRPREAVAALALGTVWSGLVAGVHLVPLALGALSRPAVLATAALVLGLALAVTRGRDGRPVDDDDDDAPTGRLPAVVAVVIAGCALASLEATAGRPFTGLDAQNFQVPIPARWLQEQTLWRLDQYIVDYSNATYPHTGNLLILAGILPWRSAFAAGLVTVPFYALGALGVHALGRELGAPRRAAALAACLFAALPVVLRTGLQGAMSDAPLVAWLAAGALFLLRHARTGERRDLVLAGLGLGLALGAKWYALTAVPILLAAWALGRRRLGRDAALLAGLVAVTGGIWLVRNWVETGNPLFPQPLLGLFGAPPDPVRERAGFSLAHYAFDFDVWRTYLRPAMAAFLGLPAVALAVGVLGALAVAARAGERRVLVAGVAGVALAAVYVVTPYSALGLEGAPAGAGVSTRYALPALIAAAAVTAWWLGRLAPPARRVAEMVAVVAVVDGLRRGFDGISLGAILAGCAAAAVALVAACRAATRPALVAGLAVAVAVAGVVTGDAMRRRAAGSGYGGTEPALAVIEAEAPAGARIGIVGTWTNEGVSPVLAAFGPRLDNEVAYVGRFEQGMLRAHRDSASFRAALARGGYDLLIVGRAASDGRPAPQEAWAGAAGWRPVAASGRLALMRSPGGDTLRSG